MVDRETINYSDLNDIGDGCGCLHQQPAVAADVTEVGLPWEKAHTWDSPDPEWHYHPEP